jgi:phage tail tape-measure protein
MIDQKITEEKITTTDVGDPPKTTQTTYLSGTAPKGDEEAGGAVAGAVGGAAVGAVVGGPVGAVVGGAIGAASGASVGAVDTRNKDVVAITTEKVSS